MDLANASVECSTSNPRRHSTIPESFSRRNMSCNRRTNLLRRKRCGTGRGSGCEPLIARGVVDVDVVEEEESMIGEAKVSENGKVQCDSTKPVGHWITRVRETSTPPRLELSTYHRMVRWSRGCRRCWSRSAKRHSRSRWSLHRYLFLLVGSRKEAGLGRR